jgi:hypothetical protein
MQLQDAFSIPKIFIGLDIHKKKLDSFYPNRFIFHKTYSMPSNAEDLYQYVERTFPDHAVDLVYEAGCCGSRHDILNLGWNVLVVNPSDKERR